MAPEHVAVGVDATPDGWVAVRYHDRDYHSVHRYADADVADDADADADDHVTDDADHHVTDDADDHVTADADDHVTDDADDHVTDDADDQLGGDDVPEDEGSPESAFAALWRDHRDADAILVDVPIGLPADDPAREPERLARDVLGQRASSVFNVPIRDVLHVDDYRTANDRQRAATGKGLMRQTFNITPRIREVDRVLAATDGVAADATQAVIREAHPEVCFWALADGDTPMLYSKTGQPAAAHWERVGTLASVHPDVDDTDATADDTGTRSRSAFHDALADAGRAIVDWQNPQLSNDDLLDAFALAVTASPLTTELRTLPEDPDVDEMGLRMEMAYAPPA
jgi:predicted RNase H-like nuclease